MLTRTLLAAIALGACASPREPAPAAPRSIVVPSASGGELAKTAPRPAARAEFQAVLHIEPQPGGKKFQGVWLERDDGERFVIAYRADAWWRPFENRRVSVKGEEYEPEGQAVMAKHFRVESLKVVDAKAEPMAEYLALGEELSMSGVFEQYQWPEGDKLAGEKQPRFMRSDGESFWLASLPDEDLEYGKNVHVRARETEPSPYTAHPGGKYLFVMEVRKE